MRYLIDTQVFIWSLISPAKLSVPVRRLLQLNTIYIAEISLFEITIKQKIGKLPALPVTTTMLVEQIERDGFERMPLAIHHIAAYDRIPLHADHRDPFDRLILATALAENMPIISADEKFRWYQEIVEVIW